MILLDDKMLAVLIFWFKCFIDYIRMVKDTLCIILLCIFTGLQIATCVDILIQAL